MFSLTEDRGLILPIICNRSLFIIFKYILIIAVSHYSGDRSVLSQFTLKYCGISLCRLANFRTGSVYFAQSMWAQITYTNHLSIPFFLSDKQNCFGCVVINIYTINNDALSILSLLHSYRLVSLCRIVPYLHGTAECRHPVQHVLHPLLTLQRFRRYLTELQTCKNRNYIVTFSLFTPLLLAYLVSNMGACQ